MVMKNRNIFVLLLGLLVMVGAKAQDLVVNETNFSKALCEALKEYAKDGVISKDNVSLVNELEIVGSGPTDEISMKGAELLPCLQKITMKNLKYDGDLSMIESLISLELDNAKLGDVVVGEYFKDFTATNNSTFVDIIVDDLNSGLGKVKLSGLGSDFTRYAPTFSGLEINGTGYVDLEVVSCSGLTYVDASKAYKVHFIDVPKLERLDWDYSWGLDEFSSSTFSRILGLPCENTGTESEPVFSMTLLPVYGGGPIASEVNFAVPNKTTPIDLASYGLSGSKVTLDASCTSYASVSKDNIVIDWGDKNSVDVKYQYACFTSGLTYMTVTLHVTIGDTKNNPKPYFASSSEPADTEAPVIKVDGKTLGATAKFDKNVTLTVTDNVEVSTVTINGVEMKKPYDIKTEGTFTVVAKDAAGNKTETKITIKYADTEAPVIKAGGKALGATATFEADVTLAITDNVKVTSVTVNGAAKSEPYALTGEGTYTVVAKDAAGNKAETKITIKYADKVAPVIKVDGKDVAAKYEKGGFNLTITDNVKVTSVNMNGKTLSSPYTIPDVNGTYYVVAMDDAGNKAEVEFVIEHPVDKVKPEIKLPGGVSTATYGTGGFNLTITDNEGIASVTINGETFKSPYTIPDEDGTYVIVVKDEAGNEASVTVVVDHSLAEPEPDPDTQKPVIKIGDLVLGASHNLEKGAVLTIEDNVGVASVTINGSVASAPYTIEDKDGTYTVIAKDAAGNTTQVVITVKKKTVDPIDPVDPIVPPVKPIIEPTDVLTKVFRRVVTEEFVGIEYIADGDCDVVVKDMNGATVATQSEKIDDVVYRVALPKGSYKVDFGSKFKSIPVVIK